MADLSRFLKKASNDWGETVQNVNENTFTNPPDGTYIMQISSAELGESKREQVQIKWGMTILDGELAGKIKYDFLGLEGKLGLDPLAWRLRDLGYKLEDIDLTKLEGVLKEIVEEGIVAKIKLTTQKDSDFQNLRIVKLLDEYEPEEQIETQAPPAPKAKAPAAEPEETTTSEAANDPDAEEGSEEDDELQIGMKVSFKDEDGKDKTGIVKSINEDTEDVEVKCGLKKITVQASKLTIVAEEKDA